MNVSKMALYALIVGIVVTWLTGYVMSPSVFLIGATWYGVPFTWIRWLAVGPQYNPWVVDYAGLIADIAFWFVVAYVAILVLCRTFYKKRAPSRAARSKR